MTGAMGSLAAICVRARRSAAGFLSDGSGIAAIEFAMVLPLMLVAFFGTVEFSSAVAIDRKVTIMARTLADLTSQGKSASDADLAVYINLSDAIMAPYSPPIYPVPNTTVTELYIDPASGNARVQWSQGSTPRAQSSIVTIPASLIARDPTTNAILPSQYLLFSEVNTLYTPTIGYVMGKAGVTLSDTAYTRPRQSICVFYPSIPSPATCPTL
jgi:Flp pilus assembly protein TadG